MLYLENNQEICFVIKKEKYRVGKEKPYYEKIKKLLDDDEVKSSVILRVLREENSKELYEEYDYIKRQREVSYMTRMFSNPIYSMNECLKEMGLDPNDVYGAKAAMGDMGENKSWDWDKNIK